MIGIALIGASTIAAEFVLAALRATTGVTVTGVLSSSPERGAEFATRFGIGQYESLSELLNDEAVGAVYVSTAHALHAEQAHAAIAAGRHVFCEKPLALSARDAGVLVAAAREAGVVLATDHHFRNAAWIRLAREMVADGAIGWPLAARLTQIIGQPEGLRRRRLDPADPGAGIIWDMTVHSADTAAFVLDRKIVRVVALASNRQCDPTAPEDTASGVFELEGGLPVSFLDSFNSPHAGSSLELHGDAASLLILDAALDEVARPRMILRVGDAEKRVDYGPPVDLYRYGAECFAEAIRGRGAPAANGVDGARSVAVAEAVRTAVRTETVATVGMVA